jgi:hypothetical protein
MSIKRFAQCPVIRCNCAGPNHDDHVQIGQRRPVPAETLADQALQSVAIHRVARLLLRYRQSQPATGVAATVDEKDRKKPVCRTPWLTVEYPPKIA